MKYKLFKSTLLIIFISSLCSAQSGYYFESKKGPDMSHVRGSNYYAEELSDGNIFRLTLSSTKPTMDVAFSASIYVTDSLGNDLINHQLMLPDSLYLHNVICIKIDGVYWIAGNCTVGSNLYLSLTKVNDDFSLDATDFHFLYDLRKHYWQEIPFGFYSFIMRYTILEDHVYLVTAGQANNFKVFTKMDKNGQVVRHRYSEIWDSTGVDASIETVTSSLDGSRIIYTTNSTVLGSVDTSLAGPITAELHQGVGKLPFSQMGMTFLKKSDHYLAWLPSVWWDITTVQSIKKCWVLTKYDHNIEVVDPTHTVFVPEYSDGEVMISALTDSYFEYEDGSSMGLGWTWHGSEATSNPYNRVVLVKFDENQERLWTKRFYIHYKAFRVYSASKTADGGILIAGLIKDLSHNDHFFPFCMKIASDGNISLASNQLESVGEVFSVSQNPTGDQVSVHRNHDGTLRNYEIAVFDMHGKRVRAPEPWKEQTMAIDLSTRPSGTYVLAVTENGRHAASLKVIKAR